MLSAALRRLRVRLSTARVAACPRRIASLARCRGRTAGAVSAQRHIASAASIRRSAGAADTGTGTGPGAAGRSGGAGGGVQRLASVKVFRVELERDATALVSDSTSSSASAAPPRLLSAATLDDPLLRAQLLDGIRAGRTERFLVSASVLPAFAAIDPSLQLAAAVAPTARMLTGGGGGGGSGTDVAAAASSSSSGAVVATTTTTTAPAGDSKPITLTDALAPYNATLCDPLRSTRPSRGQSADDDNDDDAPAEEDASYLNENTAPPVTLPPLDALHTRWWHAARDGDVATLRAIWRDQQQQPQQQQQLQQQQPLPQQNGGAVATAVPVSQRLDVNVRHPQHGGTALHAAAQNGHADVIAFLLSELPARGPNACNPNARALNLSTPLHWACGSGQVDSARALLQYGMNGQRGLDPTLRSHTWKRNVFGKGSGQTAAHWAAESGHTACVELLHRYAPQLAAGHDERAQTPHSLAVRNARTDTAAVLARAEAEPYYAVRVSVEWAMTAPLGAAVSAAGADVPRSVAGQIAAATTSASTASSTVDV